MTVRVEFGAGARPSPYECGKAVDAGQRGDGGETAGVPGSAGSRCRAG
ncbi:hypothetical protein SLNWT_0496 [Streptomyces albus]|uniref:Uncharacterized protein n=1 Tax=Streptomyces albus (strain ATCC 21838 / DSM 41398 / FERM P-419 / JCM 4703 / NBRC 107858) TaxID=1081613 RepID=A0A0B5ERX5_STRA4|nr:hypothetical protein SLNWT_0496 [Streptomyces albus]AOU75185.1 hypothetical protein SLNHY_0494 [Streptomyces albus]AYN30990.1 hypothetical protein DUI70_0487 [Streptomyces albus]